ncbi:protein ZNF365 [Gouania willdenowi]|uniref:protein ZNF365 n=1 Tax=Gouania willdenowi TaxID=441366 RepID=UPI0010567A5B|nr:protein ZNF365 [Gouania willdenowi]
MCRVGPAFQHTPVCRPSGRPRPPGPYVMQQRFDSGASGSFLLQRNGVGVAFVADLPFRCPRCGEHERFLSLASLRAHLDHRHSYRDTGAAGFSITGKLPDPLTAAIPWTDGGWRPPYVRSLSDSRDGSDHHRYGSARRRTQSVGVGTQPEEEEDEVKTEEDKIREDDLTSEQNLMSADLNEQISGLASAAVQRRLASVLRAADDSVERQLAQLSSELAQTDTELLCQRAQRQLLNRERQEVMERKRSLSRQVDVAVAVIAALREQINASENQLERQERAVVTIQKFLEAAARQETSGKVRIQNFIENLLSRIDVAERLLEYYQQQTENGPHRVSKSRSAGSPRSSPGRHDNGNRSDPSVSDWEREQRERVVQSSRLFCRPEQRNDIWNRQRRRSTGYDY